MARGASSTTLHSPGARLTRADETYARGAEEKGRRKAAGVIGLLFGTPKKAGIAEMPCQCDVAVTLWRLPVIDPIKLP